MVRKFDECPACRYNADDAFIFRKLNLGTHEASRICIVRFVEFLFTVRRSGDSECHRRVLSEKKKKRGRSQVGENGAGKTTLLKLLLGELNPSTGMRSERKTLKII